ncbi:DNase I-like protein [Hortaea werneckii]|nr:DNase I-like protein [Hortaea werneckii]
MTSNGYKIPGTRSRPTSTASSLIDDVPGAFPEQAASRDDKQDDENQASNYVSLSQAIYARRAEYVRPKSIRIKVGTWNTASYKGTIKDIGSWFVGGKGVAESVAELNIDSNQQTKSSSAEHASGVDETEHVAAQEARYKRKASTVPQGEQSTLPGGEEVGLYVLALQEVVDVNSFTEALRPYTDPSVANNWKQAIGEALPDGYSLVAEQQLIGMLLLVFANPDVKNDVKSVSTTSVGTGIAGYMGNKGAVTARIVLGDTTRLVFINSHLSAGSDKAALERRNWDAAQITSRTRFDPIQDSMDLNQSEGEQIGDEDFAFWCGDLNYRLEGIPGDDVRRLLMLHTRNEYDVSQRSARKIQSELDDSPDIVKKRVETLQSNHTSPSNSTPPSPNTHSSSRSRANTDTTRSFDAPAASHVDDLPASEDPTSLQTTLLSLLPHDELHQQMARRKAFHDGWCEGPITFLPTYKYDAGTVGVFDSSEKKRAPSWCDRILYRTRRDRLAYEAKIVEEEAAKKKDEEMRANGTDQAGNDEEILYDYDPEADGGPGPAADSGDYDEYDENEDGDEVGEDGVVVTKKGFEDELKLEYYAAHQRVLSSDHKPLDAVFTLTYAAVVPDLKAKVHSEVAKELDKTENETRPNVTVVVDKHRHEDEEKRQRSDADPASFEGVWLGDVRWGQAKHRSLTIANTGRVPARWTFIERPVAIHGVQAAGVAPKWINLSINGSSVQSSSKTAGDIRLDPGETAHVEIELRILDVSVAHELNEGLLLLDDILVLRVEGGRDHFIPIRGHWLDTSLGHSIDKLTRIPEGGIRRLQRQRPDSSKGKGGGAASSSSSAKDSTSPSSSSYGGSLPSSPTAPGRKRGNEEPVRFSAPRELFRLTEVIEGLTARVVAEWDMTHTSAPVSIDAVDTADAIDAMPPWAEHPAWPFHEECWSERTTILWQDAMSEALNALDADEPLESSLPQDMPRMQKLYVLAALLIMFLRSMPDGIITAPLWQQVESYLSAYEKAESKTKTPAPLEEKKSGIQEILAQEPSHNISFILITSMVQRITAEIAEASYNERTSLESRVSSPPTSPRKGTSAFKRVATFGRVPAAPVVEQTESAMARCLADVVIRAPVAGGGGEKAKGVQDRRKRDCIELFLRREGG